MTAVDIFTQGSDFSCDKKALDDVCRHWAVVVCGLRFEGKRKERKCTGDIFFWARQREHMHTTQCEERKLRWSERTGQSVK